MRPPSFLGKINRSGSVFSAGTLVASEEDRPAHDPIQLLFSGSAGFATFNGVFVFSRDFINLSKFALLRAIARKLVESSCDFSSVKLFSSLPDSMILRDIAIAVAYGKKKRPEPSIVRTASKCPPRGFEIMYVFGPLLPITKGTSLKSRTLILKYVANVNK